MQLSTVGPARASLDDNPIAQSLMTVNVQLEDPTLTDGRDMFDKASTSVSVFAGTSKQWRTLAMRFRTFERRYSPGFLPESRCGAYRNPLEALCLDDLLRTPGGGQSMTAREGRR